jgi:thiol-disulfide isomerase/thioredoxin
MLLYGVFFIFTQKLEFMKKYFAGLVIVLFLASCEKKAEFVAQIDGVEDNTKIFMSKLGKNNQPEPIDTTVVLNGSFKFDLNEGEPQQFNMIQIDGMPGNMFFVREEQTINATLYKDSLRSSVIEGGQHNTLLKTYMDTLQSISKKARQLSLDMRDAMNNQDREGLTQLRQEQQEMLKKDTEYRKQFAESNPTSIIAALALSDLMSSKKVPNQELKSIYDAFSDEVKDHTLGKLLIENLAKLSKTDIGAKIENFEGPSPDGQILSLEDAKGKLTLIDFWASWCKPCRMENPNVVSVYNDYKDQGFSIMSVSLDRSKDSWLKAIEDDQMDWYHISNLQYWNEPIAKEWGIRSIPATFLIDENNMIVGKNLRGNALREKVKEYLENNM